MTKHDYKQNAYYLLYLIRFVLQSKTSSKDKLDKMDLSHLYQVAQAHSLTAMATYALESAGIHDKAFTEAKNKAIRKNIVLDVERERVFTEFEKAGIWYMPLKGIILKDYYPQIGMRQMADNDILFDSSRRSDVRSIMEDSGFTTESFDKGNHDVYHKEPVLNFEMHVSLFSDAGSSQLYKYYENVKDRLIKEDNTDYEYKFTPEDFYIYITAHEYKHFSKGGTGLRSLVDSYIILKNRSKDFNFDYVKNELSKLGISEYEQKRRNLSLKLFDGIKIDTEEKQLLDQYIFSGTYGTIENIVHNSTDGTIGSKIRYIRERLFLTMPQIKNSYPFFYKHKLLLPVLFFYRLGLMVTKSRKRVISEIKTLVRV